MLLMHSENRQKKKKATKLSLILKELYKSSKLIWSRRLGHVGFYGAVRKAT